MSKIPPFYCTKTLLGFGPGPDLNRVVLNCPDDSRIVLFEMGEARSPDANSRCNALAAHLTELWNKQKE